MPIYTVYTESGLIIKRVDCPVDSYEHRPNDERWIEGFSDDLSQYVQNDVITNRPIQSTICNVNILTGFPEGATLLVNGETHNLTGETEVTLSFELSGDYPVTVSCWPYLDWEGVIHVD
jgi:hypothetical protein